jgi:hypothetical protein
MGANRAPRRNNNAAAIGTPTDTAPTTIVSGTYTDHSVDGAPIATIAWMKRVAVMPAATTIPSNAMIVASGIGLLEAGIELFRAIFMCPQFHFDYCEPG